MNSIVLSTGHPDVFIYFLCAGIVTKEVLKISANSNKSTTEQLISKLASSASEPKSVSGSKDAENDENANNGRRVSSSRNFRGSFRLPASLGFRGNNKKANGYLQVPTDLHPTHAKEEQEDEAMEGAEAPTEEIDDEIESTWVSQIGIQCSKESIAEKTCGIIFISVPHRGNQSMFFLYQFPMCFALTPEAKQLQNSELIYQ